MYRASGARRLQRELVRALKRRSDAHRSIASAALRGSPRDALVRSISDALDRDARTREFALTTLRQVCLMSTKPPASSSDAKDEANASPSQETKKNSETPVKETASATNQTTENGSDGPGAKKDANAGKGKDEKSDGSDGKGRTSFPDGSESPSAWIGQLALALAVVLGFSTIGGRGSGREISFQAFVWDLLEPGLVERIEVVNKSTARVYLKHPSQIRADETSNFDEFAGADDPANFDQPATQPEEVGGVKRPEVRSRGDVSAAATRARAQQREPRFYFNIGSVETFERKLEAVQEDLGLEPDEFVGVTYAQESNIMGELIRHLPTILLLGAGAFMMRNAFGQMGGVGGSRGGIFQVGKANPMVVKAGENSGPQISFAQVAGLDEAKTEVMEFVDFLKNPAHYEKLGAKIPKGALLVGPPGTGKTLLAKATAGEASVPFFSMSGSDFIEMFVGVGPSRVRDLFSQARASAPCIVFIDEIDAVGRARGRGGMAGGNDERENTLNALLVEMDGFTSSSGVVVLAGTNRADILDKALLRPGRFDRQINIDKPDMRGRFEIFMVHLHAIKLQEDAATVAKRLAALTPGFAGADIANICNEAALIAARNDKNAVEMEDFNSATDRVIGGLEKKNKVISQKEREIVAHHEAGHAVAGWFLKHADPLIKVSIIPRGSAALGFAQYLPVDKVLQSEDQIKDFLIVALGGRVAEQLVFDSITTGAQDDLKRVTQAVYQQVTNFGMSDKVGKIYFPRSGEAGNQFYKPYSEHTAELIDEEALRIVNEAYKACTKLLEEKLHLVKAIGERLLEKEVLGEDDLVEILGARPHAKPVDYDTFVGRFDADREDRTGKSRSNDDPFAKDASHTPPIPTADAGSSGKSSWGGPSEKSDEESIPELA